MKYPEQWTPDTAEPAPAETGKGRTDLKSMTNWKIRGPPEKPGNVMANWDESDQVFWDPTWARLTDAGCIYAILTIDKEARGKVFTYDFDMRGDPGRVRPPKGPTVTILQNNIRFYLSFKDT